MNYGLTESEVSTEGAVLRWVQGAISYKVLTGLDVNNVVNGNTQG